MMRRAITLIMLVWTIAGCAPTIVAFDLTKAMAGTTFNRQGDYIIGGTDQLSVKVFGEEKMSGPYTVAPTGVLSFPLIGFIQAEGLTSIQLEGKLQQALRPYIKSPRVTVVVTSRDSYQVFFSGEVTRPGALKLENKTTLVQGLAAAGGLTKFASGRIVLLRHFADGQVQRYATTHQQLLSGKNRLDRFVLERGDVVHAE
jgi:polysaccharide export outer membrane protein